MPPPRGRRDYAGDAGGVRGGVRQAADAAAHRRLQGRLPRGPDAAGRAAAQPARRRAAPGGHHLDRVRRLARAPARAARRVRHRRARQRDVPCRPPLPAARAHLGRRGARERAQRRRRLGHRRTRQLVHRLGQAHPRGRPQPAHLADLVPGLPRGHLERAALSRDHAVVGHVRRRLRHRHERRHRHPRVVDHGGQTVSTLPPAWAQGVRSPHPSLSQEPRQDPHGAGAGGRVVRPLRRAALRQGQRPRVRRHPARGARHPTLHRAGAARLPQRLRRCDGVVAHAAGHHEQAHRRLAAVPALWPLCGAAGPARCGGLGPDDAEALPQPGGLGRRAGARLPGRFHVRRRRHLPRAAHPRGGHHLAAGLHLWAGAAVFGVGHRRGGAARAARAHGAPLKRRGRPRPEGGARPAAQAARRLLRRRRGAAGGGLLVLPRRLGRRGPQHHLRLGPPDGRHDPARRARARPGALRQEDA